MMNYRNISGWKNYIIDSFVVAGIICTAVLSLYALKGVYPFGSGVIIWGDMALQGVPWLYQAYDILTGVSSPYFTWRFSGGMESSSLLVSLFNFPVLFTERENIYLFASIVLLYKMVCMGLSMYFFACRYDVPRGWKILSAVGYGMCSCVLIYYQIGYVMLDVAILFPILMRGFYDLMERGEYLLYVVMFAFCMSRSFYVTFMICMYLFPLSLFFLYYCTEREEFQIKCRNLVLSTLLALGISALFWLPDVTSIMGSNRAAVDGTEAGLFDGYFHKISDDDLYKISMLGVKICFLMGCSFALAALRTAWPHIKGTLRYHKAQFLLLLCAVFIPGTEVLWHGGSHNVWIVRFAFIISFAMLEILLVLRQQRLIGFSEESLLENPKKGKVFPIAICLFIICIYEIWSWYQITDDWNPLFVYTMVSVLIWYLFYHVTLNQVFSGKKFLLMAALSLEFLLHGLNWIAPSFCSTFHATQYIFPAVEISRELDHDSIASMNRTRDVDSRYHTNYASITGTNSIGNFLGSIPMQLQEQYAKLGYGTVWVRITDSGGTLFSDALLHVTSVFATDHEMDQEFYRVNPSIETVHWYDCKYVLPVGIEIRQEAAQDLTETDVFAAQNRIFREITGKNDELIQDIPVVFAKEEQQGIDIFVQGRKKVYFYGDFTYEEGKPAIEEILLNGEVFQISDRVDVQGTSYPSEDNNRVLDLGTFEDKTIHLEWKGIKEDDLSKLHVGLFDVDKMKAVVSEVCENSTTSNLEAGPDHVFLKHRAEQEGLLFLPMNYYESWKCEVNGVPEELKSVFGGFVGVPIHPGENEIRLNYVHTYPESAWYLTCCSLFLCAVLLWCRNRGFAVCSCRYLDWSVVTVYGGLAVLLFLSVYFIPALMIGKKALE